MDPQHSFQHPAAAKLPEIGPTDPFVKVVKALLPYFVHEISMPSTFDQLRTTPAGHKIRALIDHLVLSVTNPALINALLTLKWHFSTIEAGGINETRANACEIVAWRFLHRISERDAAMFCLYELPQQSVEVVRDGCHPEITEQSTLLPQFRDTPIAEPPANRRFELLRSVLNIRGTSGTESGVEEDDREHSLSSFAGLTGLEIAAVANCKKFLSQKIVQKVVDGIWKGDIIFWESLVSTTKKRPQFYNKKTADIFTRLRVPRYIKTFEVLFVASFLFWLCCVLVERNSSRITIFEFLLYIWFAAFSYNELSEFLDTKSIFYAVDIWNACDIIIIVLGFAFLMARGVGIYQGNPQIIDTAFDILSLEALFMVPRLFSIMCLLPYFGTLLPCLEAMVKDFVKFMVLVVILYLGFLATFTLLARGAFSVPEMSWFLVRVFFGGSSLGFEIMRDINPKLGPPLMVIFVCMTNVLLITSLICIQRDAFARVIAHAREEYLFVYSVYVLEASTSKRLTHFYPPLSLIPLIFIRPLRLFVASEKLRNARIFVLKVTHLPIISAIWLFELAHDQVRETNTFSTIQPTQHTVEPSAMPKTQPTHSSHGPSGSSRHPPGGPRAAELLTPSAHVNNGKDRKEAANSSIVTNTDLEGQVKELSGQVKDLSAKIAELTALVMAQQRTITPPEEDDDETA